MFWNDPTLYSTTLPYKEFGTLPVPFPLFNPYIPKFVPPTFGALPYDYRIDPRMFVQPWMQAPTFPPYIPPYNVPFMQPQGFTPFPPYNVPFMQPQGFTPFPPYNIPFMQPQGFTPFMNLPLQHFQRPFPY
jgi:hypothetical protein